MERNQDERDVAISDGPRIVVRAVLTAVKALTLEKKSPGIEDIAVMIQRNPQVSKVLNGSSEWKKFQENEILRQKKEIKALKEKLQKSVTGRRAVVVQLDAAERQSAKIKEFMQRAFLVMFQYVDTGKDRQIKNTVSRIQHLLKKSAPIYELDAAFQQLKDSGFRSELEPPTETDTAADTSALSPPLTEAADSVLSGFRKKYQNLVAGLKSFLDTAALRGIADVERRLEKALGAYELLDVRRELKRLLKAYVQRLGVEREQVAAFILEIEERLVQVQRQVAGAFREGGDANGQITTDIEQKMIYMQDLVDNTSDLEELKSRVMDCIGYLKEALEKKRRNEWQWAQKTDEQMSLLNKKLERMKLEIASAHKRTERLETEILVDPLTALPSRRAYEKEVEEMFSEYQRSQHLFSILLMDVDQFKQINDRYGHPVGDICLKGIAKRLPSLIRKTDLLFRFEGDGYIFILPETSADGAGTVAEKIRGHIEKTNFIHKGEQVRITISVGVTEINSGDRSVGDLFGRVEKALYQAKEGGRNQVATA